MTLSDFNWDRETIKEHLRQVHYWLDRFAVSRDIDHLDNAEKSDEAVKPYLPVYFQSLSLEGLYNLHLSFLLAFQKDNVGGFE